jgi:hypothetical protein
MHMHKYGGNWLLYIHTHSNMSLGENCVRICMDMRLCSLSNFPFVLHARMLGGRADLGVRGIRGERCRCECLTRGWLLLEPTLGDMGMGCCMLRVRNGNSSRHCCLVWVMLCNNAKSEIRHNMHEKLLRLTLGGLGALHAGEVHPKHIDAWNLHRLLLVLVPGRMPPPFAEKHQSGSFVRRCCDACGEKIRPGCSRKCVILRRPGSNTACMGRELGLCFSVIWLRNSNSQGHTIG